MIDRRTLLQNAMSLVAAPALPAALATTAHPGKLATPELERTVDRYFETFRAFYGTPFRPDDNTHDAHDRANKEVEKRQKTFEAAKSELIRLVMKAHGLDYENQDAPVRGLTVDVGGLTLVVSPHQDRNDEPSSPLGGEVLTLVPRTEAMRAKLDALPTLDPTEFASEEEAERLGLPPYKPIPVPTVDLSRMPAGEPVPLTVQLCKSASSPGVTEITRTWSPEGAIACKRCAGCPFGGRTLDDIEGMRNGFGRLPCEITVHDDDVDLVLYGATPAVTPFEHSNDRMVSTEWVTREGYHPRITEVIVTSRQEWEATGGDQDWTVLDHDRGTRGNLVVAMREASGPIPRVLGG